MQTRYQGKPKTPFGPNCDQRCTQPIDEYEYKNTVDLHNCPLWYNSSLSVQYRREWAQNGHRLIKDILYEKGNLLSIFELQDRGLKISYLVFET